MPDKAPARETWQYVLRTMRAYDPTIPRMASTYDETVQSLDVTHRDGIRRPTIFLSTQTARDRLVHLGWEDVTELWDGGGRAAEPALEDEQLARRRRPSYAVAIKG